MQVVSYENGEIEKDGNVLIDEVSIEYMQQLDCTEDDERYQTIKISTRNNGAARFLNIKTDDWSISDEKDMVELIEDFKKRAKIE